jgi:hypothetical protein
MPSSPINCRDQAPVRHAWRPPIGTCAGQLPAAPISLTGIALPSGWLTSGSPASPSFLEVDNMSASGEPGYASLCAIDHIRARCPRVNRRRQRELASGLVLSTLSGAKLVTGRTLLKLGSQTTPDLSRVPFTAVTFSGSPSRGASHPSARPACRLRGPVRA